MTSSQPVGLRPTVQDGVAFGLVALLGTVIAVVTSPERMPGEIAGAIALLALVGVLVAAAISADLPSGVQPVAPFAFFGVFVLLRDISGGTISRASVLVVLPIIWLALFGRRWHLVVAAALSFASFLLPSLVVGPPRYPASDWQRGLAWAVFALLIAPIVLRVVARLRSNGAQLQDTVVRLDAVTRGATLAAVVSTDLDGRITDFNPGAERLLGYTAAEAYERGLTLADLHHREELDAVASELGAATHLEALTMLARSSVESRIWRYVRSDGSEFFGRAVLTELTSADGVPTGLLMMAIDANTAIRTRQELVAERDQSNRLFEDSPQAIAVVDVTSGELLRVNDAFAALAEEPRHALANRSLEELSDTGRETIAEHLEALRTSSSGRTQSEWTTNRDGTVRHLVLSSTLLEAGPADEEPKALVTLTDVSDRYLFEQQLAHLADHDPLTGLANRRLFNRELARHVEFCRRYGPRGALLVLDLDHFKEVNDSLGHAAGDQLIISVAGIIERTVRTTDTVARLGGDEFAILLLETNREGAERVAEAVIRTVRDFVSTLDGFRRNVTVSAGVVVVDATQKSAAELLADADMTMYDAKDAGRNQYAVLDYESFQQPRMAARMAWTNRIREAIEEDRFELHLQPVQTLATQRVDGAEALLRLADSDDLVYPNQFLYIAERSDLIVDLDAWVIRTAVEMLAQLQQLHPGFQLEINVSGRSIGHAAIERTLVEELDRHDVDPTGLILEITETAAVANIELARAFAERVTALGCRFALDDFGAGFGSFYYLKHLLFDYVKIDGEFVANIDKNPTDRTIVRSIVQMSRGLGKRTVAEFVASAEIHQAIRHEGVDFAQGYHVGRAVPLPAFLDTYLGDTTVTA
ncbi:EAL domain-containing protein [Nocardioides mangrovicus]|uniref:EAL domain-containing protein n=1 Tax=Nocardioides mangrovicus TaxID=2478913 RepID=A0A3L8P5Y8_9ACTN|nr:EAL domain-containing protein [Nocardioides mangrovicus]RLV50347.1 EAL domain-containing protein [Nocardioides mangrovicus]